MRRGLLIALLLAMPIGLLATRALSLPRRELPEHIVDGDPLPFTSPSPVREPRAPRTEAPAASQAPVPRRQPSHQPPQRGVALGLFAEDVSFSYAGLIREIEALGASHIALVVPLYQTHAASTRLYLHTRLSPTLETVADTIREARRAGLEVTVFPIVRLAKPRSPEEWRGTLAPADLDAWFASYGQQVGDLASLASLTGASRLVVGSELSTLDGDLPRWQHLLSLLRAVFSGTLVYSANWDHYREARLFELVDEIGVVGYFGLRDAKGPSDVATLTASWRRIGRELDAALATYDKPFVFTEVGYRSRAGATAAPWNESPGGMPDLEEQKRGFEAFRQAFTEGQFMNGPYAQSSYRRIDGLYIWNWYGYGGAGTTGYTPRDKPATAVIRQILLDLEP